MNNFDKTFQGAHLWWDPELGIARAKSPDILDGDIAEFVLQSTIEIAEQYGEKIDWLIDLTEMKKITSRARKILAKASAHSSIRKYSFAGASVFIRTAVNFIQTAAGQKGARHFATENAALDWIRGSKP